ncbi:MAG: hypothetical protein JGK24_08405 [Microcoleus sp. PH2017_29_MFU_D_A]|jgi:hypothetical protein|uniref:hypothetical protein n=1 Tax=unclassified Microcoleus TaxID=2642155 RepID=UPI001DE04F67|nr:MULTISPECIES: hypothetical protein [unclassified Microcoleus]MCC3418871.1 hypothetical protein [Microcoleus sp. PH2017_07_MST_O_A]MCC3433428.1 hypothetical protein [Microcoleus sp. PH2017_04_SCI_O_A]MCC3443581.1 hypothetical protein [Microcoleus sp. PH2017_03_ELD_O_A]MCC3467646.1 hypothetical protein [Microcoleus sp. PH2017_06_SFM_O_A]MCC3504270.1 hypothetical protein [Microcoleus sp. PH2017_19_SFW_U_A]MCC3511716.1 hypothetical protein [Microcoleus sp. PH2017_17_BER_D_A]TAE14077.1 MAG: hy
MPRITARALLAVPDPTLIELVDAIAKLSEDKGYLQGKQGFTETIGETDYLIGALRDRIIEIQSK